jgi:hypothetical protein
MTTNLLWNARYGHPELVIAAVAITVVNVAMVEVAMRTLGSTLLRAIAPVRVAVATVLVSCACLWLLANAPVEGPVLVLISRNHGVTVADLLVIPPIVAAWALLRPRRIGPPRAIT